MNLFTLRDFVTHSGIYETWKIECDALTPEDWACLAYLVASRVPPFSVVFGVPRGGFRLASALEKYQRPGAPYRLWVDDVLTTGASITKCMVPDTDIGYVIFARGRLPQRVQALWRLDDVLLTPVEP